MNISSIFGSKKQIKSFAEQLVEVKNISRPLMTRLWL